MKVFLRCFKKEKSSHFKLSIKCQKSQLPEKTNIVNLIFDICSGCQKAKMAAIPQGAFAASKVRSNMDKDFPWERKVVAAKSAEKKNASQTYYNQTVLENPMKYSSKLMNSIWGLYNRYSVHNFKKNTDANNFFSENSLKAAVSSIPVCTSNFATRQNL